MDSSSVTMPLLSDESASAGLWNNAFEDDESSGYETNSSNDGGDWHQVKSRTGFKRILSKKKIPTKRTDRPRVIAPTGTQTSTNRPRDITSTGTQLSTNSDNAGNMFQQCARSGGTLHETANKVSGSGVSVVHVVKSSGAVINSLDYILSVPDLCDVTFLVGEDEIPVHGVRSILASRSRFMFQLFLKHQRDAEKRKTGFRSALSKSRRPKQFTNRLVVPLREHNYLTFRQFNRFMHTGTAKLTHDNCIGLLCCSTEYGMDDLKSAARRYIQSQTAAGNTEVMVAGPSAQVYYSNQTYQCALRKVGVSTDPIR